MMGQMSPGRLKGPGTPTEPLTVSGGPGGGANEESVGQTCSIQDVEPENGGGGGGGQ